MNEERFNNWTDVDNMKDHIRILEQRVDFMREKLEMLDKQEPAAYANKVIGGRKWLSIHASKESSNKWLEYRRKEQAWKEQYEQFALYTHPPQRQWAGLTEQEIKGIILSSGGMAYSAIKFTQNKLKEKNT